VVLFLTGLAYGDPLPDSKFYRNVRDFGAVGNGQTHDTKAIQEAIDSANKFGGGTVLVPAGTYLTGTIRLKSHVTLHLASGAILLGSIRVDDYPVIQPSQASWTDRYCCRTLIWGEDLEDVAIVGRGMIDGQGAKFQGKQPSKQVMDAIGAEWQGDHRYQPQPRYANRPYIIRLVGCHRILVEGITMRNSPMWMQHYLNCDEIVIRGVTVYNHCGANNDMIDIDGCHDVLIADCFGDTSDDALTFKSTTDRLTDNVTVTNCVLSSHCNAIKMGTESHGGFHNIAISNCVIRPSRDREALAGRAEGLAGIALEMVDGGTLDGITISNITIRGQTVPIFIRLGNRARRYTKDMPQPPVGTLRNVAIRNVIATEAGEIGCSITGLPGHTVEHVTLSNIRIAFSGGGASPAAGMEVPEYPDKYPESVMFGVLPAYGFYMRHVDGLTLDHVDVDWAKPDHRPALICDDVHNLRINGFRSRHAKDSGPIIVFNDVQAALIQGCMAPADVGIFCRLTGMTNRISAMSNDLSGVATPFELGPAVDRGALFMAANRIPHVEDREGGENEEPGN
jgi:hypothetical protein